MRLYLGRGLICVVLALIALQVFVRSLSRTQTSTNRSSPSLLSRTTNEENSSMQSDSRHSMNVDNDVIYHLDDKMMKENPALVQSFQSRSPHYETFRELLKHRYDEMPSKLGEDNNEEKDKYFIYRCDDSTMSGCGGWVDRIKGMLVGYVLANLTGRTFKAEIKSRGCDLHNYIVPNLVNWSLPVSFHAKVVKSDDVYIMNKVNDKNFLNTIGNINFLTHPMSQYKYVYFKANLDYTDGLKSSVFHHGQLSWMENMSRDQIQGTLYRRLIKLAPHLQKRLGDFLDKTLPSPYDKLICAHIRLGTNPTIPNDDFAKASIKIVPKVWDFIGNYSKHGNNKIILMSDSDSVMKDARRQTFGENLLVIPGKITHIEHTGGLSKDDFCEAQEKSFLEHFVLMHCDVLMISNSGFSRFPAYVRGSREGLYCLVKEGVIPCRLETLRELYNILG